MSATAHGNASIFGGSYGWASAGRFHHAQSQIHRFLNAAGGFTASVNSYSAGASAVILPHVLGPAKVLERSWVTWQAVERSTETLVMFGGMAAKNADVHGGGVSRHVVGDHLRRLSARGASIISISPLTDDLPAGVTGEHVPIRPGTDIAAMLAICFVLVSEGLYDRRFVGRCTEGFATFDRYLTGADDSVPKTPAWAAEICGIPASAIVELARRMARSRTMVNVSLSLQRSEHGEQPIWGAVAIAALLGQIGLDGGGLAYALGSTGNMGKQPLACELPTLSQGVNPIASFIPVARIADMLLNPGGTYDYNGRVLTYPDIRLVYWAGGNPFHHHQDLFRLRDAFGRPDTIVVNECFWTATASHADIVLPTTITMEREDIGAAPLDPTLVAMHRVMEPFDQARDDYAIFAELARLLGVRAEFTEDRSSSQWIRSLYDRFRNSTPRLLDELPTFDEFWRVGSAQLPLADDDGAPLCRFRDDPDQHPLSTPSGRIELFSSTIESFGYDDCPGHPAWLEPRDSPSSSTEPGVRLRLIANNPAHRLHSQLDFGQASQNSKVAGREPVRMHPDDARERCINDGDIVMLSNSIGACLAGAVVTNAVARGSVQMSTGAWFDPRVIDGREICVHGSVNVLTEDRGTSSLAQGCSGQLAVVAIERYVGEAPEVTVTTHPPLLLTSDTLD